MSKPLCIAFISLSLFLSLHSVKAVGQTVLTFDDLPGDRNAIPNGYGGLNWNNMFSEHWDTAGTAGSGYQHGAVSGTSVAYNGDGSIASTSGTPFNFIGAYLTGAWNDGLNVTVTGYNNSVQFYSQTVVASFFVPTFFEFDFNNIDTITFDSFGGTPQPAGGSGTQFAMDNFTYAVPEPSTLALLALGAVGLLCIMVKSSCVAKIRVIVVIAVTVVVGGLSPFPSISSAIGAPVPIGLGSFSGASTVIDFNSIADEQLITNQFVGQGVTFGGAIYGMTNPGDITLFPSNGGGVIASNWLYSQTANQGTSFTATFNSTENRIGFYAETNDADNTTISVIFGGNPNGPITFDTALSPIFFIGVEDLAGFDSVTVSVSGPDNNFLAVDDFRFEAVPEPSTLALITLGAIGLLAHRRNSNAKRAAQ